MNAYVFEKDLLDAPRMMYCGAPDEHGRMTIQNITPGLLYADCGPVFDSVTFMWLPSPRTAHQ